MSSNNSLPSSRPTVGMSATSLAIAIVASAIFVWHYGLRYTSPIVAFGLTVVYIIVAWLSVKYADKLDRWPWRPAIPACWIGFCATLVIMIPVESLHVDRWSMINIFWSSACEGVYPYEVADSTTHCVPGAMPFYFVLTAPSYFLDCYVLIPVIAIVAWYLFSRMTMPESSVWTGVILMVTSVLCCWELVCRSTVLFNSVLFFIWFFTLRRFCTLSWRAVIVSGIVGGLLLSMRATMGLPVAIFFCYALRNRFPLKQLVVWGVSIVAVFCLTFLPVIAAWGWDKVAAINPFMVQSGFFQTPVYTCAIVACSFIPGFFCRNFTQTVYASALYITLAVMFNLIVFVFRVSFVEWVGAFATYDMSYMLMAFPFLFYIIQLRHG